MALSFSRLLRVFFGLILTMVPFSAQALDLILCESHEHDYQYCRAQTDNRVNLKRRLSDAPCSYNRSWGYDHRGVWVADGCRAEFEVGRSRDRDQSRDYYPGSYPGRDRYGERRPEQDRDNGISDGALAAIALGALIGGALLGSAFSGSDAAPPPPPPISQPPGVYAPSSSTGSSSTGSQPYQYEDYRYGNDYERGRVPSWLVGRYRGYSSAYGSQLELAVFPDGSLQIKSGGTTDQGYYRDGEIVMSGHRYRVSPNGRDIKAVDADNPRNELMLSRIQ